MNCEYCEMKGREQELIYKDEEIIVAVKDKVLTPGQITVFPQEHFTILEQVPEPILAKCAAVANKVSIAAFETLGSQGTNIIVRNGLGAGQNVPHFGIEIIPRKENDNLNLQWKPVQLPEDEMETAFAAIHDSFKNIEQEKTEKKEEKKEKDKPTELSKEHKKEDNYMLKVLKRKP